VPGPTPIVIEGARILFRNFAGEESLYNTKGRRNFAVCIPDDMANAMLADGWNIKWLTPREEGDLPQAIIKVTVRFGKNPPRVMLVTSKGRTALDESTAQVLDFAQISNVDLIIRPYEWDINGKQGIAAYLKSIYVTIIEDELELKYRDVPEVGGAVLDALHEEEETEGPPWRD
jgi:hypothetical protein